LLLREVRSGVYLQARSSKPLAQGLLLKNFAWRTCPDRSGRADLEETNCETTTRILYSIYAKSQRKKRPSAAANLLFYIDLPKSPYSPKYSILDAAFEADMGIQDEWNAEVCRVKNRSKNGKQQQNEMQFRTIEPKILYFGTPVALVSSLNEDETTDLAPISSFLGVGMDDDSRTVDGDQDGGQFCAAS